MHFKFFIISILITSGLVGSVFAAPGDTQLIPQKFTQEEIDKMRNTAVHITTQESTMIIELFPNDAPNTVHEFLKLVESGFYDGVVFHRIIPGFMIQTGDPTTKDIESDRMLWGTGGPGYQINEEFNTIQHDRGVVSMARGDHKDSAGSQFFIVHRDANFLDGEYTVFGKVVPGFGAYSGIDDIASIETDEGDRPIDVKKATIIKAKIIYPYTSSELSTLDRNPSLVKEVTRFDSQDAKAYLNSLHNVGFHIPYRWEVLENTDPSFLAVRMEPGLMEHNVQQQVDRGGFVPQILVGAEKRNNYELTNNAISTGFFSIAGGDEPKILSNYIFTNDDGEKARLVMTTQEIQTEDETVQFKVVQIHFNNLETNYSIIYVNLSEFFRYEVTNFAYTVDNFEIIIDGEIKKMKFADSPVFKMLMEDAKEIPEPESLPPARIGGCLIATASYGSELAPQVQLLREIRDNTVLQTQSGTSFMTTFNHFYYSFSPTIADYERESPVFKEAVKLTLAPLLASLTLLQYVDIDSEHEMLGYGIGLILLNIGMYFVAPAVLITKIRSFYKLQ